MRLNPRLGLINLSLATLALACFLGAAPAEAFNVCGDGICQATGNPPENSTNCPEDCGGGEGYCGDGVCRSGENCSVCASDCRTNCLSYTLSSPLAKAGCAGDDDGDCLDNAGENDLAWIVSPNYYYDEDEGCSGAWYAQNPNAVRYGRRDFFQVRPQGSGVDAWPSVGGTKTVRITYFLLHPHDCQSHFGFGGHQGDSENIRFTVKSQDLTTWTLASADYYHHDRVHTFSGEYLKARAAEIGSAYASVAADEDGHGSWPGERGNSSACAGSEDDFCYFGTCDCFKGTMAGAFANGYREYLGTTRNVGGPCPERWRPSVVTIVGGAAYSSVDVGLGIGPVIEYWTPRTDAWRRFCGWECNLRYSTGECVYAVDGRTGCSSPLSEKVDTACFTTAAAPTCPCSGFAAGGFAAASVAPARRGSDEILGAVRDLPWLGPDASALKKTLAEAKDPAAVLVPLLADRGLARQRETLAWLLEGASEKLPAAVAPAWIDPRSKAADREAAAREILLRLSEVLAAEK